MTLKNLPEKSKEREMKIKTKYIQFLRKRIIRDFVDV